MLARGGCDGVAHVNTTAPHRSSPATETPTTPSRWAASGVKSPTTIRRQTRTDQLWIGRALTPRSAKQQALLACLTLAGWRMDADTREKKPTWHLVI